MHRQSRFYLPLEDLTPALHDGTVSVVVSWLIRVGVFCLCVGGCREAKQELSAPPQLNLGSVATLPSAPAIAAEVYVPVYSRLVYSEGHGAIELSALLTIRNTDSMNPIIVESVRYYDSSGKLLRDELAEPGVLAPLATATLLLKKSDEAGGTGANYLVRWRSAAAVTEPVLEVLMADLSMSHSLAFTSRGTTTRSNRGAPLPQ